MEFTRAKLETLRSARGYYLVSDLAALALVQLDKIEGLELDAEDAREDIDALDQQVVKLRARLESAEAERDILQWASEHAGKGELVSDREWESDPHPEGEACDVGECSCNMGEPERPHEALVWALFYSDGISIGAADAMLEQWRVRWPNPNEDNR